MRAGWVGRWVMRAASTCWRPYRMTGATSLASMVADATAESPGSPVVRRLVHEREVQNPRLAITPLIAAGGMTWPSAGYGTHNGSVYMVGDHLVGRSSHEVYRAPESINLDPKRPNGACCHRTCRGSTVTICQRPARLIRLVVFPVQRMRSSVTTDRTCRLPRVGSLGTVGDRGRQETTNAVSAWYARLRACSPMALWHGVARPPRVHEAPASRFKASMNVSPACGTGSHPAFANFCIIHVGKVNS